MQFVALFKYQRLFSRLLRWTRDGEVMQSHILWACLSKKTAKCRQHVKYRYFFLLSEARYSPLPASCMRARVSSLCFLSEKTAAGVKCFLVHIADSGGLAHLEKREISRWARAVSCTSGPTIVRQSHCVMPHWF